MVSQPHYLQLVVLVTPLVEPEHGLGWKGPYRSSHPTPGHGHDTSGDGAPTAPPGSLGQGQMLIFDRGMTEMQMWSTQKSIFAHVLQDLQKFL